MRNSFLFNFLLCGLIFSTFCGASRCSTTLAQASLRPVEKSSPDQKFLQELLDRGLFRLAELHCRNRLASDAISPAVQAELTLELIRVFQEKALCAPTPEQKELDLQTKTLYEDFRNSNVDCPWLPVVDFQFAVGVFAQAQRAEMEARFALEPEKKILEAQALIRDAIQKFLNVDSAREKAVLAIAQEGTAPGKRARKSGKKQDERNGVSSASLFSDDGLSICELESLKNQIQLKLLLAYELQAMTYPENSLDRMTSLKEALSRAGNLTLVPTGSSVYWNARLEEIRCLRLQKDFETAEKRLDLLADQMKKSGESTPDALRLETIAEQLRLYLAENNMEKAVQIVRNEFHSQLLGKNGELDCAILEFWLAQWNSAMKKNEEGAKNEEEVRKFRDETLEILNIIRAKSAPWWVRKAELLFDGMLKNAGESQNLSFLQMAAENAAANFDPDAVRACENLWNAAVSQKEPETALHAAQMAGALLYRNQKKNDAASWFRKFSIAFPDHPAAMENHSLAIQIESECVADALDSANGKLDDSLNAKLDRFQLLILEHFQKFGKKDPEILALLQKLETISRIRQNFAECVDVSMLLAANTAPEDERFLKIVDSGFENWRRYLDELQKENPSEFPQALFTAIQWIETLPPSQNRASGTFFLLNFVEKLRAQFSKKEISQLNDAEKAFQKKLLEMEIRLFKSMKPYLQAFPDDIRDEIEQLGINAMILAGNRKDAFPSYEKFAQKFPNSLEIQRTWGQLLADEALRSKENSRLTQALKQWRRIEKHVPDDSSDWYEAKFWIIRLQIELGETRLAARLLRTFRILHPDLGGEKWKKQFLKLNELLESATNEE